MDNNSYASLYRRILPAIGMLAIGLVVTAALIRFTESAEVPDEPEFGVVRGVVYSPPRSCAVVDKEMVREGDAICDVAIVAINNDSVEFSKAGVTWQQEVLETPHEAWTDSAKLGTCDGE